MEAAGKTKIKPKQKKKKKVIMMSFFQIKPGVIENQV